MFVTLRCNTASDNVTYTLYRSSVTDNNLRIHIATFDSVDANKEMLKSYNKENCKIAADLFLSQPGVRVEYWCEQGRFKK